LEGTVSQFLDTLKARLADAQQRLQVAQQTLQKAQLEHNAVMQEYGSWQNAVAVETRREQQQQQPNASPALPPPTFAPLQPERRIIRSIPVAVSQPGTAQQPQHLTPQVAASLGMQLPARNDSEINKADLIRDVLQQHPNGITPADVWRKVRDHVGRAYVYSVLKRLKDRKQASERRGKYFLQIVPKAEEKEIGHVN
jgi:hypothetical protein